MGIIHQIRGIELSLVSVRVAIRPPAPEWSLAEALQRDAGIDLAQTSRRIAFARMYETRDTGNRLHGD